MRKSIIGNEGQGTLPSGDWLDLALSARVELSSEDPAHPFEGALEGMGEVGTGWRASEAGEQTVRLLFDRPLKLKKILLVFTEKEVPRTQEFLLRWSADGATYRDVVRQQFNFAPPQNTREVEEYTVELSGVSVLELKIVPDMNRGNARANIALIKLAAVPL